MADIYVLASVPDQGKTTTAILLEKYFQNKGMKVACLQNEKGPFDVHTYLENGCYHYTIPLEAAKNRKSFEQWLPKGYEVYIFEIMYPQSPIGAVHVDLFENVNELISFDLKGSWKNYVSDQMLEHWGRINPANSDVMALWNIFHNRTVKPVYTKTREKTNDASVDSSFSLVHPEKFLSEPIQAKYQFPKGTKKTIAVGAFPAEYWDIYPNLCWYRFDYAAFMERFKKGDYDLVIIGVGGTDTLKFRFKPETSEIICYHPSVYHDLTHARCHLPLKDDFLAVYQTIKNEPVGTPLGKDGGCFAAYNNKYWTYRPHNNFEQIRQEDNILFCNGWILPQYLIRDGYLEVN